MWSYLVVVVDVGCVCNVKLNLVIVCYVVCYDLMYFDCFVFVVFGYYVVDWLC